jgi:hypothetical protein
VSSLGSTRAHRRHILAAVAALTAAGLALTSPATAEAGAARPLAKVQRGALQLEGQVRNGTPLDARPGDTRIIVPQGLPVVAHARVSIPQLALSVTTDSQGRFALSVPAASARRSVSVTVTAAGFGTWTESGIRLSAAGPTSIYVELHHAAQSFAAPRPGRQAYNGLLRAAPSRGIRQARPVSGKPNAYVFCGHNSSGWTSQTEPPSTIRVYMTGTGTVVRFDFTFYVEHVLPNEWGSGAPSAALQAGAEAVRDYAWYFILHGSKGTAADVNPCSFDVDDTTAYQDFQPGGPAPANTNAAVTSTGSTVFSRGGTITETSYCSNFVTGCGADSPPDSCGQLSGGGGSMSQIGSDSCAFDGFSWQRILTTYYHPGYSFSSQAKAYTFWKGRNGALYEAGGPANGPATFRTWLGMGPLGSAPSAGVDGHGTTYVYWAGTGRRPSLYEAYWNGSRWVGPFDRHMKPLGSPPSVAVTAGGKAYVFWKGRNGPLYEASGRANGSLSGPVSRGMGPLGSAPSAGVDSHGATYVYWAGTSTRPSLNEGFWDGSRWVGPFDRHMKPLGSPPGVAVTAGGRAYVFWKGRNGPLYEAGGPANGSLSGPVWRGMGPLGSAPSAGVDSHGATYVYWAGDGNRPNLYEGFWDGSAWVGAFDRHMKPLGSPPSVAVHG